MYADYQYQMESKFAIQDKIILTIQLSKQRSGESVAKNINNKYSQFVHLKDLQGLVIKNKNNGICYDSMSYRFMLIRCQKKMGLKYNSIIKISKKILKNQFWWGLKECLTKKSQFFKAYNNKHLIPLYNQILINQYTENQYQYRSKTNEMNKQTNRFT